MGRCIEYVPPATGLLIVTDVIVVVAPLLVAWRNIATGLLDALKVTAVLPDIALGVATAVTAVPKSPQDGAVPAPLVNNTRPAVEADNFASVVVPLM